MAALSTQIQRCVGYLAKQSRKMSSGKNVSAYYPQKYVQRRKDELIPALLREGHWHIEQTVLPCQRENRSRHCKAHS